MNGNLDRLVKDVINGEYEAFDRLYETMWPLVNEAAREHVGEQDAMDVAQEVFTSIFENIPRIKDVRTFFAMLDRLLSYELLKLSIERSRGGLSLERLYESTRGDCGDYSGFQVARRLQTV